MATQTTQASNLVKYEKNSVEKLVGRVPRLDPSTGEHLRGGKNNVFLYDRKSVKQEYTFPVIQLKEIKDTSDIQWAVDEILAQNMPGYSSLSQVVEYLNHGLKRGPGIMLNQGKDIRLSAAQLQALTTMVGVVKQGLMTLEQVTDILTRQGIPDAEQEVRARMLEGEVEDEE
jgi:hypothetical protein